MNDFDFLLGRWHIHNRKLADPLDPQCTEWVEFQATGTAQPVLGGLGNTDTFSAAAMPPDGRPFEGMTVRLYEPRAALWRIWWASTRAPGHLDPPMEGRFTGRHGVFLGDDEVAGKPIKARFDWYGDMHMPRWEQAFSFDGGRTWIPNWVMSFARPA